MEEIPLNILSLVAFNKNRPEHITFLKQLVSDESIKTWFGGISASLLHSKDNQFLNRGFFVSLETRLIGYVQIGAFYPEEGSVYLRYAISANERKKGLGKLLLSEVTDYIFARMPAVKNVKLKIDNKNTASLNTALSCGFKWIIDDFYAKYNPTLDIIQNISKR